VLKSCTGHLKRFAKAAFQQRMPPQRLRAKTHQLFSSAGTVLDGCSAAHADTINDSAANYLQ